MLNKLIFSAEVILKPYMQSRKNSIDSDNAGELQRLKTLADENLRKRETLSGLVAQNFIEPSVYAKENGALLSEASEISKKRQSIVQNLDGQTAKSSASNDIYKFAVNSEMLTKFDDDLFARFVDHVTVMTRNEVVFSLKCGLDLKETI